jgi:hypothetical protein
MLGKGRGNLTHVQDRIAHLRLWTDDELSNISEAQYFPSKKFKKDVKSLERNLTREKWHKMKTSPTFRPPIDS